MQVLEAQESQRETELRHLRSVVDENAAAMELAHVTGQLLPMFAELIAVM
jgi:hypothetical protein